MMTAEERKHVQEGSIKRKWEIKRVVQMQAIRIQKENKQNNAARATTVSTYNYC